MRGLQRKRDPTRMACSMAEVVQRRGFLQAGKAEQTEQRKVSSEPKSELDGQETVPPAELQEVLWKQFFADTSQWWDYRRSKRTPLHPDFKHKVSKTPLWLNNWLKPHWVDSQLATMDASWTARTESGVHTGKRPGSFPASEGNLEVGNLCEDGNIADAVDALHLQVQRGCYVRRDVFYRLLKRCIQSKDLALGIQIHALTVKGGYEGDGFLATQLIGLYASLGKLEEATGVFNKVPTPDAYNWAAIIFAYARHGNAVNAAEAIRLYRQMSQLTTVKADDCLYSAILKACTVAKDLGAGKEVHARILASSKKPDKYVEAGLVYMYAKCGSIHDARRLFDKLPRRNLLAWNAMIAGYAQRGMGQEALSLYRNMQQEELSPNSVTYVCLLQACASVGAGALGEAKQLHARIEKQGLQQNAILSGSLINMYAKCGSLEQARDMFEKLSIRDVIIWTALIAGYSQRGMGQEALSLYSRMQQEGLTPPDAVTYVCLLQACANVGGGALDEGKQLHAKIIERGLEEDMVVGGSLVNMYAKCGGLEEARTVFDKLPNKHVVTWTALISGYAQQGFGEEALTLYGSMQQQGLTVPDSVTYVCLLQACASVGAQGLDKGKQLHTQIRQEGLECDQVLGGSLVNMYAKCGSLEEARVVFDKLSNRGVVTWTTMIAGYAQEGMGHEALSLYTSMQQDGLTPPDSVTYTCLLHACAAVAALPLGEQLHAEIEERGMQADGSVGAALVNMYAKCGSMNAAQQVFDSLIERSIEAWSALVGGYASQGESEVVFDLLERMRSEGVNPDEITFLSVLTVCSHVGLVDKGRKYFEAMRTDYGISATMEHYICMVDLLGRAGHLDEALHMAKTMLFPPNDVLWRALLGACRKWKNVEIGQQAFEGAISVAARDAASYVMMSNIYASAQMWEAAEEMQAQAMRLGAWKKPGQSWCADVGGVLHTFIVGDKKDTENTGYLCTADIATCNKEQSIYALPRFVVRHDSTKLLRAH